MKKGRLIVVCVIIVFTASCSNFLCGEHELKQVVEEINSTHKGLNVEVIPCEYNYINVHLKNTEVDTASLLEIHQRLYYKNEKKGWPVIKVYSKEKKYIFSLNHNGKVFMREED